HTLIDALLSPLRMRTCDGEHNQDFATNAPTAERIRLDGARVSKTLVSLFLSQRVAIPQGNCNSSSIVWEKVINPDETYHAS
ncbi:MAG: hypothetical protein WB696_30145, partial [Chthoniobacterales bacterium]